MNKPSHPLWAFLYWLTSVLILMFILWITATKFDMSEGKAIAGYGGLAAVSSLLFEAIRKKTS